MSYFLVSLKVIPAKKIHEKIPEKIMHLLMVSYISVRKKTLRTTKATKKTRRFRG